MAVLSVPKQKEDLAEGCAGIKKTCLLDLSPFLTQAHSRAYKIHILLRRKTETTQRAAQSSAHSSVYMPHWSIFYFLVHPASIFSVPSSDQNLFGFYVSLWMSAQCLLHHDKKLIFLMLGADDGFLQSETNFQG